MHLIFGTLRAKGSDSDSHLPWPGSCRLYRGRGLGKKAVLDSYSSTYSFLDSHNLHLPNDIPLSGSRQEHPNSHHNRPCELDNFPNSSPRSYSTHLDRPDGLERAEKADRGVVLFDRDYNTLLCLLTLDSQKGKWT